VVRLVVVHLVIHKNCKIIFSQADLAIVIWVGVAAKVVIEVD
jgi:hypothetical protein